MTREKKPGMDYRAGILRLIPRKNLPGDLRYNTKDDIRQDSFYYRRGIDYMIEEVWQVIVEYFMYREPLCMSSYHGALFSVKSRKPD